MQLAPTMKVFHLSPSLSPNDGLVSQVYIIVLAKLTQWSAGLFWSSHTSNLMSRGKKFISKSPITSVPTLSYCVSYWLVFHTPTFHHLCTPKHKQTVSYISWQHNTDHQFSVPYTPASIYCCTAVLHLYQQVNLHTTFTHNHVCHYVQH